MTGLEYVLFVKGVVGTHLAEMLGVSPQLVNHWLKARRTIPHEYLEILEKEFGIPSSYLTRYIDGKDRIEIEILLGFEHSNKDLQKTITELNNLKMNYTKLLEKNIELRNTANNFKSKAIELITTNM